VYCHTSEVIGLKLRPYSARQVIAFVDRATSGGVAMNIILGVLAIIGAILFFIKAISDIREGVGDLAKIKNPFLRFLGFIIGLPLLVIGVILLTAHDVAPFEPNIFATPTICFPNCPGSTPFQFPTATP
jgi:hypothetical protein